MIEKTPANREEIPFARDVQEHGERSFVPARLRRWLRDAGLSVVADGYCCLVPYFCREPAARLLKRMEPAFEAVPGLRQLSCGAYSVLGTRPPGAN